MTHLMTPTEYTAALSTLSLTPEQAATWLGIGRSTAYRYLKTGCEGPVVVAIEREMRVRSLEPALFLALDVLGDFEPDNARAISDAYVAMAVIACDQSDDDGSAMAIIQSELCARNNPNALPSDLTAAVGVGS